MGAHRKGVRAYHGQTLLRATGTGALLLGQSILAAVPRDVVTKGVGERLEAEYRRTPRVAGVAARWVIPREDGAEPGAFSRSRSIPDLGQRSYCQRVRGNAQVLCPLAARRETQTRHVASAD